MTTIHKVQVEVAAGKGIAEAFDVAAKNGCTEISLTIPVPKTRQKPTAQERLRTRATALELIGSCLVAGDKELARQSFRSALLEHLHAHLSEVFDASCHFTTLAELIADDQAQDPVLLSKKLDQAVAVPLVKEHEIFAEKGKDDRAPVVRIELEQMHTPIQEPLHKAFCQLVDQYAQTVSQHIDPFVRARIQQLGPGQTSFGIIPELTPLTLDTTLDRTELVTAGSVSLYASHHWG